MRRLCPALALLLIAPAALAQTGSYTVSGGNPSAELMGGTPYTGTATVVATGETFRMDWQTGSVSTGVGLAADDVFAVAFGGDGCGVVLYTRNDDGSLTGRWAAYGAETVGAERLVPVSDGSSTFRVTGFNPGGSGAYEGTVELGRRGPTFTLHWALGNQAYDGVGLRFGSHFGVAYGGASCGIAMYERNAAGERAGFWATMGSAQVGHETLTPQK